MSEAELYLRVRQQEGRLYTDDLARRLPDVPSGHPLAAEWAARRDSMQRLLRYMESLQHAVRVMDLGCGNGWLSRHLAEAPGVQLWGIDRQSSELSQAARLFTGARLAFLAADVFTAPFAAGTFDLIMLASSVQYFPSLRGLLLVLLPLLKAGGELHILDSPLYEPGELDAARRRSEAYYASLGLPEMAEHYFHHTVTELDDFAPVWLYRPAKWSGRMAMLTGRVASPFPWLCIRKAT